MPCADPIPAFRPAVGGPLKFQAPKDGRAYSPIEVPCGTCILCREEQGRQWAVRLTAEAQMHEESCFITLTYNDKHKPPYGGLQYEDLTKFWKRLRKNKTPLKYYAVGEYGDKTHRPHYHAALFGRAYVPGRIIVRRNPTILWTHPELEQAWGLGNVSVGALNFQTASYTASYLMKKLVSKQTYVRINEETGELIQLEQPRAFMSRNLAKTWFEKYGQQVYDHDYIVIQGKRQKPPKAYDKWFADKNPLNKKKMEEIKEERKKEAKPIDQEQNRARARNAHARAKKRIKSV